MKRFKCTVTRVDEYEIELDETKMTPEWMAEFASYMYGFKTLEEHAEHLAQLRARFPNSDSAEGYGAFRVNGRLPYGIRPEDDELGINIVVISEDGDIDVDVEEA